jgi:hypothetical protein
MTSIDEDIYIYTVLLYHKKVFINVLNEPYKHLFERKKKKTTLKHIEDKKTK